MAYEIEWKRSALKELKQLPQSIIARVLIAVESLAENPHPLGNRKLTGADHTFRLRVGDYRLVYTIDDNILVVEIVRVRHRKDVYR